LESPTQNPIQVWILEASGATQLSTRFWKLRVKKSLMKQNLKLRIIFQVWWFETMSGIAEDNKMKNVQMANFPCFLFNIPCPFYIYIASGNHRSRNRGFYLSFGCKHETDRCY